jgi:hypothetical protein
LAKIFLKSQHRSPIETENPHKLSLISGSISNIGDDTDYKCKDGSSPEVRNKVISGVVGAASSVTSIQVANLLRLFKIPQVSCHCFDFLNNIAENWRK